MSQDNQSILFLVRFVCICLLFIKFCVWVCAKSSNKSKLVVIFFWCLNEMQTIIIDEVISTNKQTGKGKTANHNQRKTETQKLEILTI